MKLVKKQHETTNIWSFFFEPLDNFSWKAGQSIRIEVPRKSYGYNERRFTITSFPTNNYLKITTRLSDSEFKQDLHSLSAGSVLNAYNIEGDFEWGNLSKPKLFIAGGTGVNPFKMLIEQSINEKISTEINLIYLSKDTPPLYIKELEKWHKSGKLTNLYISPKRLKYTEIIKLTPDIKKMDVYIAGPDQMVIQLQNHLNDHKIEAKYID